MGGWVCLRNGWTVGLQKLTTVLGRLDTYKGGVLFYINNHICIKTISVQGGVCS